MFCSCAQVLLPLHRDRKLIILWTHSGYAVRLRLSDKDILWLHAIISIGMQQQCLLSKCLNCLIKSRDCADIMLVYVQVLELGYNITWCGCVSVDVSLHLISRWFLFPRLHSTKAFSRDGPGFFVRCSFMKFTTRQMQNHSSVLCFWRPTQWMESHNELKRLSFETLLSRLIKHYQEKRERGTCLPLKVIFGECDVASGAQNLDHT